MENEKNNETTDFYIDQYKKATPKANKFLLSDGSVVDENNNLIEKNDYFKKKYEQANPTPLKYLHPDGTIDENGGGGGGGGTLYADLPLLSWIKYDDQENLPEGFLKAGDSVSQSEYPEVYAKYGSTVPYKADTSELGDYENITFPATAQYDGVIIATAYDGGTLTFRINDNPVYIRTQSSGINAGTATVPIHKGDVIGLDSSAGNYNLKVRYYKKSLIVKAKQVSLPVDLNTAVEEKAEEVATEVATEQYSTTETKTNKVWIDGKPIYRKVFEGTSANNAYSTISNVASLSIKSVVGLYGTMEIALGKEFAFSGLYMDSHTVDNTFQLYVADNLTELRNGAFGTLANKPIKVILEYTKTTD